MFYLQEPHERTLRDIFERHRELPLSYAEVGCTRGVCPPGYVLDTYEIQLGTGAEIFEQARQAMRAWRMLQLGWIKPCWPGAAVQQGELIGTKARICGLWAVNVCRIVYVFDSPGPLARYGLAYGTLPGHAECGEEQFLIEQRDDDAVWYSIRAISKPGGWLTRAAYPITRSLQRRFGADSLSAMATATDRAL